MQRQKTTCYLCGEVAEELLGYNRILRIRCPACGNFYSLTQDVQRFRFDKEKHQFSYKEPGQKERIYLTAEQKKELLNYVKMKNDIKGRIPVSITLKVIDNIMRIK